MGFREERFSYLSVFAERICLFGLWGIKAGVLFGLPCTDGTLHFYSTYSEKLPEKAGIEHKIAIFHYATINDLQFQMHKLK